MCYFHLGKSKSAILREQIFYLQYSLRGKKCDSEGADVLFKALLEENQMCDCNSM